MTARLSPSMMCAKIDRLAEVLKDFQAAGVEYLHIDVMDGVFVPNYTLGTDYVRQLRNLSPIPLDIHLMITRPEDKIAWFNPQPGEYISVHHESTEDVSAALSIIREAGAKPMLAVNPGTPWRAVMPHAHAIDAVLVMTVNPGYAGQALIESTLPKIRELRDWLDASGHGNVEIEVDGNVSFDNARRMRAMGANLFVAGSSSVFAAGLTLREGVDRLREAVE